ncbi:MAG: ATP synthase F1 subunit epsilon [Planctomycetaceae bacterium]|nr:ATP synthase F1 subunit epsilon [Planctomycetaceae bacterium]
MKCLVVTPEETVLDVDATFVALPLYDGEIGIAENHTPLVGRLGYGELRISRDKNVTSDVTSYYVEGGFVEVLNNTVSLLTNKAVPLGSLNLQESQAELESALKKTVQTEEQLHLKEQTVAAARAQVHLAQKSAGKS